MMETIWTGLRTTDWQFMCIAVTSAAVFVAAYFLAVTGWRDRYCEVSNFVKNAAREDNRTLLDVPVTDWLEYRLADLLARDGYDYWAAICVLTAAALSGAGVKKVRIALLGGNGKTTGSVVYFRHARRWWAYELKHCVLFPTSEEEALSADRFSIDRLTEVREDALEYSWYTDGLELKPVTIPVGVSPDVQNAARRALDYLEVSQQARLEEAV